MLPLLLTYNYPCHCWPTRVCCHTLTKPDYLAPLQNSTVLAYQSMLPHTHQAWLPSALTRTRQEHRLPPKHILRPTLKYRRVPFNPNMDNSNSWLFWSSMEIACSLLLFFFELRGRHLYWPPKRGSNGDYARTTVLRDSWVGAKGSYPRELRVLRPITKGVISFLLWLGVSLVTTME